MVEVGQLFVRQCDLDHRVPKIYKRVEEGTDQYGSFNAVCLQTQDALWVDPQYMIPYDPSKDSRP